MCGSSARCLPGARFVKRIGRRVIPEISGLRALLACQIFLYHWFFDHASSFPLLLRAPFDVGYVGVAGFFVLSGFLLTVRYYPAVERRELRYGQFMVKRFVRIYPLYFVVLTLLVVALGRPKHVVPHGARALLVAYSLSQGLFPSLLSVGTAVAWSLTVIMLFYFVAPPIMRWVGRGRALSAVFLRSLLVGMVGVAVGLLITSLPSGHLLHDTLVDASPNYILHYTIFGRLPEFLVGMVAGFLFLRQDADSRIAHYSSAMTWAGLIGSLVCMIALDASSSELGSPANQLIALGIALCVGSLIAGMACSRRGSNPVSRILGTRVMVYLGSISYALFLIQLTEPCQWLYWVFLGEACGIENQIVRAVLLYGLTNGIAAILYEVVERPSTRLLRKWLIRQDA